MQDKRAYQYILCILLVLFAIPHSIAHAACPLPAATDVSIGANTCTISGITGADNAVVTLDNVASAITINNGGELCLKSLVVNAGSTAIQAGGTIKPGCSVYMVDADNDGYPVSLTTYDGTGTSRRKLSALTSITNLDCNDASATYFATLTCYPDGDADTYYSKASHSVCAGSTCASIGESATLGTDCCDSSANAKPGQTAYFTSALTNATGCAITVGTNDYDYDCGGTNVLDSTGIQASTYACTNPCGGCALNYGATAGWLTAPPSTCGGSGTLYSMTGSYVSGTCYAVGACSTLVTSATTQRGCH